MQRHSSASSPSRGVEQAALDLVSPPAGDASDSPGMRIEELARKVSMTTRNVRSYQERGLLPPPVIRRRMAYYSVDHLHRLELIRQLQDRGFSLESIRHVLDAWARGAQLDDVLGLRRIITDAWTDEPVVELTHDDILSLFPAAAEDPSLVARAVALRLLSPVDDARYSTPRVLMQAGVGLLRLGLSLADVFLLVERLQEDARTTARHLVDVVSHRLLDPVAEESVSPEELHELTSTALELRGMAIDVVRCFMAMQLDGAVDEALERFRARIAPTTQGVGYSDSPGTTNATPPRTDATT